MFSWLVASLRIPNRSSSTILSTTARKVLNREKRICTWHTDTQAYRNRCTQGWSARCARSRSVRMCGGAFSGRRSVLFSCMVYQSELAWTHVWRTYARYINVCYIVEKFVHRVDASFQIRNMPFRVLRSQALPHRLGVPWRAGRLTISLSIHAVLADKTKFQPIYRIDARNGRWLTYRISLIRRREPRTGYAYANKILMPLDRNILYPVRSSRSFNGMPSTALRDTRLASREWKKRKRKKEKKKRNSGGDKIISYFLHGASLRSNATLSYTRLHTHSTCTRNEDSVPMERLRVRRLRMASVSKSERGREFFFSFPFLFSLLFFFLFLFFKSWITWRSLGKRKKRDRARERRYEF